MQNLFSKYLSAYLRSDMAQSGIKSQNELIF